MKALLRTVDHAGVIVPCLVFWCPGCAREVELADGTAHTTSGLHMLPVNTTARTPAWGWDENLEAPTLTPSILTHGAGEWRCHSFLRAGVFEFLGDSSHPLAGQHVPMPDLPEWVTRD